MDFDKEYRNHMLGLNRKIRVKHSENRENDSNIFDSISHDDIINEFKRNIEILFKGEKEGSWNWKYEKIEGGDYPERYRITITSDNWTYTPPSAYKDSLYLFAIVQPKEFIERLTKRYSSRFSVPGVEKENKDLREVKMAHFFSMKKECDYLFYIFMKSYANPVFDNLENTSDLSVYTKEEIEVFSNKEDYINVLDKEGSEVGVCFHLTRSNLYLSLRMALNAISRKTKMLKDDRMLQSSLLESEGTHSLGLAGKAKEKFKKKDEIDEVSDYKYIKIVRNLLYGYSKICYADLIDSMNAVCKLLVKHVNVQDKASGAFVFKDKLNLMLGDLGTTIQITVKEKSSLRGSILMNHFVAKMHTKNAFDDIPSSKKFGTQYQALFKLSSDFTDFVVSVAHEHPELFDFLDTLEKVTKEYDYTAFKEIFSSLNEGTANLGFAERISKKYKQDKEDIDKAFEISTVKEAVDFFTDALKLKGYQEVEDVYFIPDEEQLCYDISFRSLPNGEDFAILNVKFGKYFPYKEIKKSRQCGNFYIGRDNGIVSISANKKLVGLFKRFFGPEYKEGYGWIASSSIFAGIANFMKDYEEDVQEIQEGLANKIINKFNDKKEEPIDNIKDGSKEVAKDSAEFISMLIEEGRLRDMIPEGYEDNKPRFREADQFGDVTSYQIFTSKNGGDYDAEKKVNVMGHVKSYWPVTTYSSMEIVTMIGRGWYCNSRNIMSVRIRFGKNSNSDNDSPYTWIDNIEVGKMSSKTSYNPKDYGPFIHIDLARFNKSADINEDGTIALTRTNAIIILEIFRSYFRHRDDKVKAKVKKRGLFINSRGEYVNSPNWVYDIEDKEVWRILRGLNTKKSNKAFFLNMMKHCWSKDFNIK